MSAIPAAIGGAGAAALGTAAVLYSREGTATPLVIASGIAGAVLLTAGLTKKSVKRGSPTCDLNRQSKLVAGTGDWAEEMGEDGQPVQVYRSEKAVLGLPLQSDPSVVLDGMGLVVSCSEAVRTTYDFIFGADSFDSRDALGYCIRQHTFKDAVLKDGKPNPKPSIVDVPGEWKMMTYVEVKRRARAFGTCLRKAPYSIGQREKVAIWAQNSVEWMLADLSCAAYGWTSVSVYDTLGPDAASYIIGDSGAKVVICEHKTFMRIPFVLQDETYTQNPGADLQVVVHIGEGDAATREKLVARGIKVIGFSEACQQHLEDLETDTPPTADDIATIMYTSGTTGMPKGVMLKHQNIVSIISVMRGLNPSFSLCREDVHLSYLPLAHIFERQNSTAVLSLGGAVYFASNGSKALLADLAAIRPTIFAGVPKVYENVRDTVVRKMTGFKKTLFEGALRAKAADIETGCGYSWLWDALVFSKTKKALGGRVRFCVTGGAPISKDTLTFVLCALGPVAQGYGATETSAASTLSMAFDLELGHVGPPIGTVAIRLVDAPDMNYFSGPAEQYPSNHKALTGRGKAGGEVWIGGPSVSPGYYDPSEHGLKPGVPSNGMVKKTKDDFFTECGWTWFKTGDIGTLTERGTLKIVDRKKNMFKTSLGEYIPVEEVEKAYQDNCDLVDFVFLPKETKVSYIAVCVVVSESARAAMQWAKENGVPGDEAAVVSSERFRQHLHAKFSEIAKAKKLQSFLKVQKPQHIHSEYKAPGYQDDWVTGVACANGHREQLLTATFKARRAQLDQYFAPVFPKIYPDRPADHILP